MWYVERNAGQVTGLYANFNEGVTEPEPLADDHPDVLAYRARMEPRPIADAMPLIIGGLHARIEALEARTDAEVHAEVLHILTTSGDPPDDMVSDAIDEEDPGEQPEIFDEEDVAAAGEAGEESGDVAVQEEAQAAGPVSGQSADGDGASAGAGEADGAYPGIAILPNVLADARDKAKVLITDAAVARVSIVNDPTSIQNAQAAFSAYNNYPAGTPIPEDVERAYRLYVLEPAAKESRIWAHMRDLIDAANRAVEVDALQAMINDLDQRWPT